MNLQENIQRIKHMMGIITESTDKIETPKGEIVLVSDWVKNHIKEHNHFGTGSVFREGITDDDINNFITMVTESYDLGDGGAFEIEVPNIGYDLVKPYEEALGLENAVETTAIKKEGKNEIEVPLIKTTETADNFSTNILTLVIRKSNPNFLPDDVKEDTKLLEMINEGKVYSLLTAFPGNPNIPKASEWNGEYAVILPKKKMHRGEQNEGEITEKCWKGYTQKGMKTMFGKRYPNCVKKTK